MLFCTILTGAYGMLPPMAATSPLLRLLTAVALIFPCFIPESKAGDLAIHAALHQSGSE